MKLCKCVLYCFLFFLLFSCNKYRDDGTYDDRYDPYDLNDLYDYGGDRRTDRRGYFDDDRSRLSEIQRLRGSAGLIEAELEPRFDGGWYYEGYEGESCKESDSCKRICDEEIARKNRSRCYNAPSVVVGQLKDGFRALLDIDNILEPVDITPGLIAGMLDIRVELVSDLVENKMSEGDLKSFLAWVAIRRDIAEVFLQEDRRSEVMKSAFRTLGELQLEAVSGEKTGLNTGLIQNEDSLFYLSAEMDNVAAFQIAYKVLKSLCNSRDCKMDLLCARNIENRNRRSRVFRPPLNSRLPGGFESRNPIGRGLTTICRTSSEQGRRVRNSALCYIHGAAVWSYLSEMIEENEVREYDFLGEGNEITVERCNDYCGDEDSNRCQKLQ